MHRTGARIGKLLAAGLVAAAAAAAGQLQAQPAAAAADVVLTGGRILTLDSRESVAQALAIRGARIVRAGSDREVAPLIGKDTRVIRLGGAMVVPGFIEAHVHSLAVAREEHFQPWVELTSIAEVQDWLRRRAREVPPGRWIRVVRTDITRLKERRHPTPAELDASCPAHPVVFNAARKNAVNSLGLRVMGITPEMRTFRGARILRDGAGNVLLIAGADDYFRKVVERPSLEGEALIGGLERVLRRYNEVGITATCERGLNVEGYRTYRQMQRAGRLTVRMTASLLAPGRTAEEFEASVRKIGLRPHDGDEWVRAAYLKILSDGGIHWGTTFLREPYGPKRIAFYRLPDPDYRGDFFFTGDNLNAIIRSGHRMGWPMVVHVTGDAGVDRVLDAMEAADRDRPIRDRRFTLTHAYFPTPEAVSRARRLGVCVDTQPYLYYKDSSAIGDVYGRGWAERLIGLGDWIHGGVATAINSDHMIGMDPDHAMNSFSPFLQIYIAVSRKNGNGQVIGERQKISRIQALRAMTSSAAYLTFREGDTGTLESGKLADLAVLDRDLLACPEEEIPRIRVQMTMVGGKVVFERPISAAAAGLRLGIIGTDTSHAVIFTQTFNDPSRQDHVPGARVVAAYKGGSPDIQASWSRVDQFAAELQDKWSVEMVPDIPTLCSKVDAILLETNDGRRHLEQAKQVIAARKPMFIDKPLASTLEDAREIARLAREAGVPWFSSSSGRFGGIAAAMRFPDTTGVFTWGPGPLEEHHHLDLSWYAIHSVELLYTLMGTGCEEVSRISAPDYDVVVGRWKDGRLGTMRVSRNRWDRGAVVFRPKQVVQSDPAMRGEYTHLLREIVKFFQTGTPPVSPEETLEIFAFMDAAQRSKAAGGRPMPLR